MPPKPLDVFNRTCNRNFTSTVRGDRIAKGPSAEGLTELRQSSTEQDIRNDLSELADPISASIETAPWTMVLSERRVDGVTLVNRMARTACCPNAC